MKIILVLFSAASMFAFTACNNGAESTTSTDSSKTEMDTSMSHSAMPDTAMSGHDLSKLMDGMMGKMHAMQMTGDFDIDFANMMIEHHQGAINMSQVELSKGSDEKMKGMAQNIIDVQGKEQQMLREFLKSYKPSGMKHGEGDMQKSMAGMMESMKEMQMSGNVDKDFATMMISHHTDGVAMAKMQVKNGMSDKLKQIARKEITDQQKDISEFKSWLSANK